MVLISVLEGTWLEAIASRGLYPEKDFVVYRHSQCTGIYASVMRKAATGKSADQATCLVIISQWKTSLVICRQHLAHNVESLEYVPPLLTRWPHGHQRQDVGSICMLNSSTGRMGQKRMLSVALAGAGQDISLGCGAWLKAAKPRPCGSEQGSHVQQPCCGTYSFKSYWTGLRNGAQYAI
eukprot:268447-Pelagomonas_calceolata.AAC.2